MASVFLEELKTVPIEVNKSEITDAVGRSWTFLAVEEEPQGREIGNLQAEAGEEEEGRV